MRKGQENLFSKDKERKEINVLRMALNLPPLIKKQKQCLKCGELFTAIEASEKNYFCPTCRRHNESQRLLVI